MKKGVIARPTPKRNFKLKIRQSTSRLFAPVQLHILPSMISPSPYVNSGSTAASDVPQAERLLRDGAHSMEEHGRLERPRRFHGEGLLVLRRGIASVEDCLG